MPTLTNAERDVLLLTWQAAAAAKAKAEAEEKAARLAILDKLFDWSDDELRETTDSISLGNGWKITAEFKTTRTLDNKDGQTSRALHKIAELGPDFAGYASNLVRWKPELNAKPYKAAPPNVKALLSDALTTKPALPAVKIIGPETK